MDPRYLPMFLCGLLGGGAAYLAGLPMPFLLGGIVGTATFVLSYEKRGTALPRLSRVVRMNFAALISAMIGTRFSPDLLPLLPQFWVSIPAVLAFVLVAHAGSFAILRRIGRYRRQDAYFAALPGGIVDSAILAEDAGADMRIVTAQHLIRIILVVATVPLLFWLIRGDVVGSFAGETMSVGAYGPRDILTILCIALTGLLAGYGMGLPVPQLMGPLLLGLTLSVTGLVSVAIPGWMLHLAQYMMGVSLGAQFSGMSRKLLLRGLGTGLVAGLYMLVLAAGCAALMIHLVPAGFGVMFISFAAGGIAEMSLIALTLDSSPVVVALHHLARIFLSIWIGRTLWTRVFGSQDEA